MLAATRKSTLQTAADLPVSQSPKVEFINLQTARSLGLEMPDTNCSPAPTVATWWGCLLAGG
jgi:hypothetical protein